MNNLAEKSREYQKGYVGMLLHRAWYEAWLRPQDPSYDRMAECVRAGVRAFLSGDYKDTFHWCMDLHELLHPEDPPRWALAE